SKTQAYVTILSFIALIAQPLASLRLQRHLNTLLFVCWLVYAVRDLFPLATFSLIPLDISDALLWPKVALLTLVGTVVPLCVPHPHIPIDPSKPSENPPPEQTVSWLSFVTFSFLDPLVWKGFRSTHLAWDELPPLADYDRAEHLRGRAFPDLDPFHPNNPPEKRRHIFFHIMHVFRVEYAFLALGMALRVLAAFLAPIGLNRLLNYIETGGEGAVVRPWVWVFWLFLGPWLGSVIFECYIFATTRMLVRTEAMITQLVFEHALRIRPKEDGPQADSSSAAANGSASSVSSVAEGKKPDRPGTTAPRKGDNLVGRINNLVTTDLNNIIDARDFLFIFIYCPLQLVICIWFLYEVLGIASFAGLATMFVTFPLPGWVATQVNKITKERAKKTDARVQEVTETMGLLRMIKMFAWEPKIHERLSVKREDELEWIRKARTMTLVNMNLNFAIPLLTMIAAYATYTLALGQELSASRVFSSMVVFELLRDQFRIAGFSIPVVIQAKVSLDRLSDFLHSTELLDRFTAKLEDAPPLIALDTPPDPSCIGFEDASFRWALSSPSSGASTPGSMASSSTSHRRDFMLHVPGRLEFLRGTLNLVVGPTGCGKTSLLLALCGELHFEPQSAGAWYNLPKEGGVAYAAQEGWVQNDTIRGNILFGAPYDEERYRKVVYQCGLERDLTLFAAGDMTEVGEKGLTLSGGQKARITLARAVYSKAETLLLDDVLAALDVHTSRWIVEQCFQGDIVQGRTVILVTHNIPLVANVATFVVALSIDGHVVGRGSTADVLASNQKELAGIVEEAEQAKEQDEKEDQFIDVPALDVKTKSFENAGKLIVAEEIATGHVSWAALSLYFKTLGGFGFWMIYLGGIAVSNVVIVMQTWFLGYWAQQYDYGEHVSASKYIAGYSGLVVLSLTLYSVAFMAFVYGSMRASRLIHNRLIDSILGTTLRWLDVVPVSRVITRCTQDLRSIDGPLGVMFAEVVETSFAILCRMGAIVLMSPAFVLPALLVAVIGWACGQVYMKSQLSVKREMSNARSPLLGHFGAAMAGLTSIRIYAAEAAFNTEMMRRMDIYTRAARSYYNLNRWIGVRINAIGGLFSAGLAAYLIYGTTPGASATGFSLSLVSETILWWTRNLNQFEVEGNSLERIQQFIDIEQEPKPTEAGKPPAYWPASGHLRVEHLEAKYSTDGPLVLRDVNFELKSGERIGVVGRTGSGKSSLTLALLRCIFTSGHVYYDGLATDAINLDALRGNITIIPQQPELLSGTLRQNLDPFDEHDDAALNDALRAAGLSSLQASSAEGKITLDTPISSGGGNLSLGQRQIIALARAITRRSKILILDEGAGKRIPDHATDTAIQDSIRRELKDVTLITVAHRLRTIMDADKIMVLDAGRLVEFDSPRALLKHKRGHLRSLVDGSSDRDELIAMAHGGQ
ncbi:P-loop containing nucleoside triphosphate hydrolase protein, partial [Auricularia subglabra TFB-10046 SS5]